MHHVLITGANGFVGRNLCALLVKNGFAVRGCFRNVQRASSMPAVSDIVESGEIDATTDWLGALDGIDAVVHLAARVHIMNDASIDPLAAFRETNVKGTRRLAEQAARSGVKRFIYLSSTKVCGEETHEAPFTSRSTPAPEDPYAVSKLEAENFLKDLAARTAMQIVIIRPPLVYGPGVGANFLRLIRLTEKGLPLPFASVNNRRSLLFVLNLCDFIRCCLLKPLERENTFTIADGSAVSTPELIRELARCLGKQAILLPVPVRLLRWVGAILGKGAEIARLCDSLEIDMSEARSALDWTPPFSMSQGLQQTVDWYRESVRDSAQ